MSSNAEVDEIVALRPDPVLVEAVPELPPTIETSAPAKRSRPLWLPSVAVGAVGLIASGTLGYFLYSTTNQRDALGHRLASTQTTLVSTKQELSTAQSDAAARKAVADYVSLYVVNHGRVQTDYQNIVNCDNYSQCRTAAQQMLTDMQKFQSDRASATVPRALANSDSMLGDALSAAIAGDQEFITGLDNNDRAKIKDGIQKFEAALLSMAKAESALGTAIR